MPINYKFDNEKQLIRTEVNGELTMEKTLEYFKRLQQDDRIPANAIEIVDFDDAEDFTISYSDMRLITHNYQTTKSQKRILGTIFVSKSDIAYGIARMLEALHEVANEQHIVTIVRSDDELDEKISELRSQQ